MACRNEMISVGIHHRKIAASAAARKRACKPPLIQNIHQHNVAGAESV
jgi:hypothetical protein